MHHQLQKLKQGGSSLAIQNQDSFNQELLKKGNQEETYALKVINKSVLHPKEINALKTESGILRDLVGLCNVVQFMNIFETQKYTKFQNRKNREFTNSKKYAWECSQIFLKPNINLPIFMGLVGTGPK